MDQKIYRNFDQVRKGRRNEKEQTISGLKSKIYIKDCWIEGKNERMREEQNEKESI